MKLNSLVFAAAVSLLATAGCQSPAPVVLDILHTNDIHSHLKAAKIDPFGLGGMAKLRTLLSQLRAGAANSVTLDAGDWSEGTWYYDIDTGADMLKILSTLGYDAACLGNHDFLQGPDQLIRTIASANPSFPVLAANIDASGYSDAAHLATVMPPSLIKQVGPLKVGIIGLTTYGFLYESYLAPVQITNPIDAATALAQQMRPNVDVLIVVSHNDFDVNKQLAANVPGVDAVISGHSHLKTPKAVMVENAGRQIPVVEAGSWGQFVGDLKLSIDPLKKTVSFSSYQLHAVTSDLPDDSTVAKMVADQDAQLAAKVGVDPSAVTAQADFDLPQETNNESALGNLAVQSYRYATGADLSLEEISLTGVGLAKGPLTLKDLHDVAPHLYNSQTGKEWTVETWNAKGSDLAAVFNIFYKIDGLLPFSSPIGWLSADNVQLTWDPSSVASFVQSIQIAGKPIDPGARYKVALTSGLMDSFNQANDKFGIGLDLSQVTNSGTEAWKAVSDYAASLGHLTVATLGVGGHVFTKTANLAIFNYGVSWDGSNISVQVQNQGLQQSGDITVSCYSGLANDWVDYGTDQQKWTLIGGVPLEPLAAGESAAAQIPWSSNGLAAGYWPVHCAVLDDATAHDAFALTKDAYKVFQVSSSSAR